MAPLGAPTVGRPLERQRRYRPDVALPGGHAVSRGDDVTRVTAGGPANTSHADKDVIRRLSMTSRQTWRQDSVNSGQQRMRGAGGSSSIRSVSSLIDNEFLFRPIKQLHTDRQLLTTPFDMT